MTKKNFLTALTASALCILLIFEGSEISSGIRRGLFMCSNSVIPSLFPFMAISIFICKSSAADFFAVLFNPITKLLKLPPICGGVLLTAIIGGYPAAAKCINDLVCGGFVSRKTAAGMLCFCVNAGPSFLIGVIGIGLFGSIKIGTLIFAAQLISSLFIAAVISFFSNESENISKPKYPSKSSSAVIVESIISAAENCFRMCAFIVIACAVSEVIFSSDLSFAVKSPLIKAVFTGIFEVTAGVLECGNINGFSAIITAGAIASFSGISVILQVAAVTDESKISLFPFIVSRFVHSALTALILRIFLLFSKDTAEVFSIKNPAIDAAVSASAPAAVSLLCMAALFLLSIVPPKSESEPFLEHIKNKYIKK